MWKGIILAGGSGTRLAPLTKVTNKHLLPVYDKPMIYYPLTTLMLCGIRDIVIVSSPDSLPKFESLLGSGQQWGIQLSYSEQSEPRGIADSFLCAEDFIRDSNTALILGDNIFYGSGLPQRLQLAMDRMRGACVLGYEVADPSAFGVVELDENGKPISLVEKPLEPRSNLAVTGLYFYDHRVLDMAKDLAPSKRGELEITDINRIYQEIEALDVVTLGRGTAWLDGGTHSDLFEASQFIKVIEERTGLKVACPEEVAIRSGFIEHSDLERLVSDMPPNGYREYLSAVLASL